MSDSDPNEAFAVLVKVIHFKVKQFARSHKQLHFLLQEMDFTYKDILLHSTVMWLRCGNALERF